MDFELWRHLDRTDTLACAAVDDAPDVDWLDAQAELDHCDGYIVIAIDPQTGEVDAHGPYVDVHALTAAEQMRSTFDREEMDDVAVRIVRWHAADRGSGRRAA